jgi:hypothetical protein
MALHKRLRSWLAVASLLTLTSVWLLRPSEVLQQKQSALSSSSNNRTSRSTVQEGLECIPAANDADEAGERRKRISAASSVFSASKTELLPIDSVCAMDVTIAHPDLPPTNNFSVYRTPAGVIIGCYWNDVVCTSIREHSVFGPNIHRLMSGALLEMRREARLAADILATRLGMPVLRERELDSSDVTMVDVGAHVGSIGLDMWNQGYNVQLVEGMPSNAWIVQYSMCANRKAQPSNRRHVALTHAALGAEPADCVVVSSKENFGDGFFHCGAEEAALGRQSIATNHGGWIGTPGHMVRGFVKSHTLDSIVFGCGSTIASAPLCGGWNHMNHAAMKHFRIPFMTHVFQPNPGSMKVSIEMPTTDLLSLLRYKQYAMKLDIEGSEVRAWKGAPRWLASPEIRPKLIISAMWLSLNWTTYGEMMFQHHYTAFLLPRKLMPLPNMSALLAVQTQIKEKMIDMLWLQRSYLHLLKPMAAATGWVV